MQDFFPTMSMKPNPQCDDRNCRKQQEEHKVYIYPSEYMRGYIIWIIIENSYLDLEYKINGFWILKVLFIVSLS